MNGVRKTSDKIETEAYHLEVGDRLLIENDQ